MKITTNVEINCYSLIKKFCALVKKCSEMFLRRRKLFLNECNEPTFHKSETAASETWDMEAESFFLDVLVGAGIMSSEK